MTLRVLALLLALGASVPARAAVPSTIAAVPGSATLGFGTPTVPMVPGDTLTLRNFDVVSFHGVRSEALGSDEQPWCGPLNPGPESPTNPRRFPRGHCPLFWSDIASTAGGARPVLGAGLLESGRAYGFLCWVFPAMKGVVVTT